MRFRTRDRGLDRINVGVCGHACPPFMGATPGILGFGLFSFIRLDSLPAACTSIFKPQTASRPRSTIMDENLSYCTCTQAMDFMESLPRDLLFIMRTQSIVRALCSDLGQSDDSLYFILGWERERVSE